MRGLRVKSVRRAAEAGDRVSLRGVQTETADARVERVRVEGAFRPEGLRKGRRGAIRLVLHEDAGPAGFTGKEEDGKDAQPKKKHEERRDKEPCFPG